MNIVNGSGWKVVVDHHINPLEVNAPPHQIGTYQDPDLHGNGTRNLEKIVRSSKTVILEEADQL